MNLKELLGDSYKDGMTMDEIDTAIQSLDLEADKREVQRLKNANDKLSSENAERKRKERELLSEDERIKTEQAEALKAAQERVKVLEREKTISDHTKEFAILGYSEKLAQETATALADGDMAKVFGNQKIFLAERDKAMKAQQMRDMPDPQAGGGTGETVVDYSKQIQEARAVGDTVRVAALLRMQQQNKT